MIRWLNVGKKKPSALQKQPDKAWLNKVRSGLLTSSGRIQEGLKNIFVRKKLDQEMLESLEELLLMTDLGVMVTTELCQHLKQNKFDKEVTLEEVKQTLAEGIESILNPLATPLPFDSLHRPYVVLVCGVNGTGKTTTIGKLAAQYQQDGCNVMIAACDTFRAAAVEQLDVWSKRAGVPLIQGKLGADPAAVAFEAFQQARQSKADILMIDTAGRLHNKKNLMEELAKITRVLQKADPLAPHATIIILDATTGQNARLQVRTFKELIPLTGAIITKLDGTAKGGIVVSIAKEFGLALHAIGVGEGLDDLQPFDAKIFTHSLLGL